MSDRRKVADARECVNRLDKYVKGLDAIIKMCELVAPFGTYRKLPANFQAEHGKDMRTIISDLIAMKRDAQEMASIKADHVYSLDNGREGKNE